VVGFQHYSELPDKIRSTLASLEHQAAPSLMVGSPTVPFRRETDRWQLTAAHTAYIRVAEGCDHACTFCAIPGFRGSFRSKPFDVVVAEAEALVGRGVREINLIAEDTNQYGADWGASDPRRLPELLTAIAALPELRWIRLLYCYPSYFSPELISAIGAIDKVVKYIDIPLQHLSSTALRRMRRPGAAATLGILQRLRDEVPGLVLRTTFISGFPGETEAEHRELVTLARELRFERGGAFVYSAEDGTPAAEMEQLPDGVGAARRDELSTIFQQNGREWAEEQVGKVLQVMVDGMEGGDAIARSQGDAPDIDGTVRIPAMPLAPGTVLRVRVVAADDLDLVAQPLFE